MPGETGFSDFSISSRKLLLFRTQTPPNSSHQVPGLQVPLRHVERVFGDDTRWNPTGYKALSYPCIHYEKLVMLQLLCSFIF